MVEKYGRGFGAAIAVLLAVSCLFIGKVVAVDSPNSPVGILVRMAQGGSQPAESPAPPAASANLRAPDTDRQQSAAAQPQGAETAESPPPAVPVEQGAGEGPALTPEENRPLVPVMQDGGLTGRVAVFDPISRIKRPAERMRMALLQGGQVVADFQTQFDGTFAVSGLNPGPYSLVGIGQDGYVAFGVELQDDRSVGTQEAEPSGEVASELALQPHEIDVLAVPPIDAPVVLSIAQRHLPPDLMSRGTSVTSDPVTETPEAPQQATGEGTDRQVPDGAVFAQAEPAVAAQNDQHVPHDVVAVDAPPSEVQLAADRSLSGSIRSLDVPAGQAPGTRNLTVFLVQDGQVAGSAPVSPEGSFTFGSVAPGTYSFVAAGTDGFAAFSVRVVSGSVARSETPDALYVPVGLLQADFPGLIATLVMAEDVSFAIAQLAAATTGPDAPLATPLGPWGLDPFGPPGFGPGGGYAGGGFGGGAGFGGGGGYGFGGGGLGTALGLAALGVGIAALVIAEDDDDDRIIATPF